LIDAKKVLKKGKLKYSEPENKDIVSFQGFHVDAVQYFIGGTV
jgi:hypothetical protein